MKHELAAKNESIELNQDVVAEKIFKLEEEVTKQAAQIAVMNGQIVQLQTALEENRKMTAANEVAAATERETLAGEIEQYRSIVEMMNAQIEGFEKTSFELVGASLMAAHANETGAADGKSERSTAYDKMVAENKAAMASVDAVKQELEKAAAVARQETEQKAAAAEVAAEEKKATTTVETSTLTESTLSYESIQVSKYHVMVKQLNGEMAKLLEENLQLNEMVSFAIVTIS